MTTSALITPQVEVLLKLSQARSFRISFARQLLDDGDAPTMRGTLGLGDIATHAVAEFDAAGLAAAAQAFAIQRANHTGTQSADTIVDGAANKVLTAAMAAKLAGIAAGATANDTDANLKARANHTGTQLLATISDAGTAAAANTGVGAGGNVPTRDQADARYAPFTPAVRTDLGTTGAQAIDMAVVDGTYQTIAATGNITFSTSNLTAGRTVTIRITAAVTRTLTFPATWVFLNGVPTQIVAGKTGILTLTSFGTTDANVVAAWSTS